MHKAIRLILKPNQQKGGLQKVDIPATDTTTEPIPIGPDPTTWNGAWTTITDPSQIANHVCAANVRPYHQAHGTPFGSEPLLSYIGYNADQEGAQHILEGRLPNHNITKNLLSETKAILDTVLNMGTNHLPSLPTTIMPDKFVSLYKTLDERTSSSPSGRHLGHYKAATQNELLSHLHSHLMSIPYKVGFAPDRWKQVIDVMLEKSAGNSKNHRLRIIALQESDFNQGNRLNLGRPLIHNLEDVKLLPPMQQVSWPSRLCITAVLNKVISMEIHRYLKRPSAYLENDATGCYDRIVNPLILLCLRKLGATPSLVAALAKTWEGTFHRIKTLYGISTEQYQNAMDCLLYGPGQGSTIGPLLWLLCFLLTHNSLSPEIPRIILTLVYKMTTVEQVGEAFVDDTSLG
jgi:hypothetical protein